MFDLPRAALTYSWTQSVFGVQQALAAIAPRAAGADEPVAAFRAAGRATAEHLGPTLRTARGVGELIQNEALDLLARAATDPRYAAGLPIVTGHRSLMAARAVLSERTRHAAVQEFRNKVQVFQWVRGVRGLLGLPPTGLGLGLPELVERAYAMDPFPALWAVEGAGHEYATAALDRDPYPSCLLTGPAVGGVPDKAMTMLHAGIGLGFAERQLDRLGPGSSSAAVGAAVERFLSFCWANARPGYVGASLEALGLVARVFYPRGMVAIVDRELVRRDEDTRAYFWHGVGRGLYFSASYFLPVVASAWDAVLTGFAEVPDEFARRNAVAGLAWATAMVNLRTPAVIAAVVAAHGPALASDGAFANGIASSMVMRADTTPGVAFVTAFCDADGTEHWDELVRRPCQFAVREWHDRLATAGRLGEVFRY